MATKGKYIAFRDINIKKALKKIGAQSSFWAGLLLLFTILVINLFVPCPTMTQYMFLRIAMAMALGSFAASLSSFISIRHQDILKFGSGFIVFAIAYFGNPASVVINDDCSSMEKIRGRIFVNDHPVAGIKVSAPFLNEYDLTNSEGYFEIPYDVNAVDRSFEINLNHTNLDTNIRISYPPPTGLLTIELPDTIEGINKAVVRALIQKHLEQVQEEAEAEHLRFMYRHNGKEANLDELSMAFASFERTHVRYRNEVGFSNGFIKISTQKGMRAEGIEIDPFNPYKAYHFSEYDIFLYQFEQTQEGYNQKMNLHFALLNKKDPAFTIDRLKYVNPKKLIVLVSHVENIRYIRTHARFDSDYGRRHQKSHYHGVRPKEEYVIRYIDNDWRIFDTKN